MIFSPDGKTLASASLDKTVKLWDATNGNLLKTLTGHRARVESVIFLPDGKTLASASRDKTVKLWDATTKREIKTLTGHTETVISEISFSPPDDAKLASASFDEMVKPWDATTKREINIPTEHTSYDDRLIFLPDGKILASASFDYGVTTVILWNLDLDDLLVRGCRLIRDYLKNSPDDSPDVSQEDRKLCDGIKS